MEENIKIFFIFISLFGEIRYGEPIKQINKQEGHDGPGLLTRDTGPII